MRRCGGCGTLLVARLPSNPAEAERYERYYHAGNLEIPHSWNGVWVRSSPDSSDTARMGAGSTWAAARAP